MQCNQVSLLPAQVFLGFTTYFSTPQPTNIRRESAFKTESTSELKVKRRALVVDDVLDVTEMLEVLLTHAGYDVVTASSPFKAITSAKDQQFDLVISDIGMPEMNGYELCKKLRELPGYRTIPMVAVTGYSMFDDRERSLRSGFTAHMTKPIEPRALLDLIEKL
jgi:CheY-like chemotaxis protein